MRCGCDSPVSHVLPAPDREFIEERDGVPALDGCEQCAVGRAQVLVAATASSRVRDGIARFAAAVRIAGVDAPEVRQERDEPALALVDAVPYTVRAIDLGPRENFAFALLSRLFPCA